MLVIEVCACRKWRGFYAMAELFVRI